jgi:hypothetical protein
MASLISWSWRMDSGSAFSARAVRRGWATVIRFSIMYVSGSLVGASHLVSRSSPRCSHWGLPAARPPSPRSSCPRTSSSAVSELLQALLTSPRPPPSPDLLLHGRPPFWLCCVERVAGTSAEVLAGHKKLKVASVNSEYHHLHIPHSEHYRRTLFTQLTIADHSNHTALFFHIT